MLEASNVAQTWDDPLQTEGLSVQLVSFIVTAENPLPT